MKGKYVLLDFWASWCGPCRAELPYVKRLVEKHGSNENFSLIGISLDRGEAPMKEFISKNEMNWMNVYDGSGGQIASQYGVVSIPFTVLIDPEGKRHCDDATGCGHVEGNRRQAGWSLRLTEVSRSDPGTVSGSSR